MTTISTIIISYNTADLTVQAIQTTLDNYHQDKLDGEVIVVDNASSDNSVEVLKKKFGKKIALIESKQNLGFAGANNLAITKARGEFYFLLNSDTILKPHAIKNLLSVFADFPSDYRTQQLQASKDLLDRVGIVSGKLLNPDGSTQPQGGALPTLANLISWWLWPLPSDMPLFPTAQKYHIEDLLYFDQLHNQGWLGGTALLIKKAVIEEIGNLDENIFMYAEDVEFCWRAHKHHWDVVYTPSAEIVHLGSASSSNLNARVGEIRGLKYTLAKHQPKWKYQASLLILRLGAYLRWLLFGIIFNDVQKKRTYKTILEILG